MTTLKQLFRIAKAALFAGVVCAPMFLRARPRTPLRVFCIAAFEFLAKLRGGTLGARRRLTIAHACDFGSLRDKYYDHQKLDRTEYRLLRRALSRLGPDAPTSRYIQELRKAERGRPSVTANNPRLAGEIISYRASVIALSLRWLQGISGLTLDRAHFDSLTSLVCLMQLADDLLDWKEDQAARCPSYVTACYDAQSGGMISIRLRAQADLFLQRTLEAARADASVLPFALGSLATWMFVATLIKLRNPG